MPSWLTVDRRRALQLALLGAVALILVVRQCVRHAHSVPRPGSRLRRCLIERSPPPRLMVHVVGAVRRPGLYRLVEGSRVADAVGRAGGATRRADLQGINLAAPVADGLQVVVPRRGSSSAGADGRPATGGPVHLNTATLEQLDTLPGSRPGHRAEDRRVPRAQRRVRLRRRPRRGVRHRSRAARDAARAGGAVNRRIGAHAGQHVALRGSAPDWPGRMPGGRRRPSACCWLPRSASPRRLAPGACRS